MIKYIPEETSAVFSEIPEEISLAINISGCLNNCPGCHSPYLRENIGEELTLDILRDLIIKNSGISCVCFMGEGKDKKALLSLAHEIKQTYPNLHIALYSGRNEVESEFNDYFDYIKIGPYIEAKGPLNSFTTNQVLYKIINGVREDITYLFWRNIPGVKAKFLISDDKEQVERIRLGLEKKKEKFGEKYCPCVIPKFHGPDTICPCKNYRETGDCHCKMYKS